MIMKIKTFILIFSAAALVALPSCHKKDEETEVDPYLDGTLTFSMPLFVLKGDVMTLTPEGASNPTGGVGYYWYNSWTEKRDTVKRENETGDGSWTVTIPSETGTYTVSAAAFAEGYTSLSAYKEFVVVDSSLEGSVKGAGYQKDSVTFSDPRDGGLYYLATAGGNVWMQNNLYYSGSGISYENSPAMDRIAGRLYNWNEAVEACPEGWHLPSDSDFAALAGSDGEEYSAGQIFTGAAGSLMSNVTFNDLRMWTFWPEVKITNSTKFAAIPFGYAIDQEGINRFTGTNKYSVFWTSDNDEDTAVYRYIYVDKNNVYPANGDKESFRASVRCVKD